MKHCTVVCVIVMLVKCQLFAATVTEASAQTVALNFYKTNTSAANGHISYSASLAYTLTDSDGVNDFYVFDINSNAGFVIVSATDNVSPVIGYSTEGTFNPNIPEIGLKDWIAYASGGIKRARQQNMPASARAANLWNAYKQGINPAMEKSTAVAPLLTTTWDQSPYYNDLCPYDNTLKARSVTGCVATAMAQVMKYWNYPAKGTGSYTYVDSISNGFYENIGTQSANFGATTYQWSSMPSSIGSSNTAVATLMYHCGVALAMNYTGNASYAYIYNNTSPSAYIALKKYFGYASVTLRSINLTSDTASWISTIESELTAGRPVMYAGQDIHNLGGHCWVCDGVDANNMFHMNWGWSGSANGYFSVSDLDPESYDFVVSESILVGIQPPAAPVVNFGVNKPITCSGLVQFSDSTSGGANNWLWTFGDGTTSTLQNPVHQYSTNGAYSVSLAVSSPYGTKTKTISNLVTVSRAAGPPGKNGGNCQPGAFSLGLNTTSSVTWYDSTGNFLSSANPYTTPTLSKTTTYWAEAWNIDTTSHTTYNAGPPSTIGHSLYAYTSSNNYLQLKFNVVIPIVLQSVLVYSGITGSRTIICTNAAGTTIASKTLALTNGGNQVTLNFNLPAGGPYYLGFTNDSMMQFTQEGITYPYSDAAGAVQITGNNLGEAGWYAYFYNWVVSEPAFCISLRVPVTAAIGSVTASVSASGATTFCQGGSVTLTASGGTTYNWSNGATAQAITATTAGSYLVTVSSGVSCSAVSAPLAVVVNALPTASIAANGATTFCQGSSVTLTASGGTTYKWSNGGTTQSITATTAGSYAVTASNSAGCSAISAPLVLVVNTPAAIVTASGATTFCKGGSVTLTASGGTTYKWSNSATTPSITTSSAGSYIVTATSSAGCTVASAPEVVVVNTPSASITANGATTFCQGSSVTLTASGGTPYKWSNGATTQAITATTAGSYVVTVSSGTNCSAISAPSVVIVNSSPAASVSAGSATTFCKGGSVTLTAKAGTGYSYKWSNSATTQAITANASGSYTATVTANGCSSTSAATRVTVNALPNNTIAVSGSICSGSETLTARKGNGNMFKWSNGETTRSISVKTAGTYTVTLTSASQCTAKGSNSVSCTQGLAGEESGKSNGAGSLDNATFTATGYPNPYTGQFHLKIARSNIADIIHIKIYDVNGRLLEERESAADNDDLLFGDAYSAGVYVVQLQQAAVMKQVRMVKVD